MNVTHTMENCVTSSAQEKLCWKRFRPMTLAIATTAIRMMLNETTKRSNLSAAAFTARSIRMRIALP